MNWELGSVIGGIATAIGVCVPFVVKYFKKRAKEKADEKLWRIDVSGSLEDLKSDMQEVKGTQSTHSDRIEANEKAIAEKNTDCKLKHIDVDNRINLLINNTNLLKEVVSSVKNIEDKQNLIEEKQSIAANDIRHIKELFNEKLASQGKELSNMSEDLRRVEGVVFK